VVFVVDDDASIRDSLRRLISSVGFKVETFAVRVGSWSRGGDAPHVPSDRPRRARSAANR